MNSQEEALDCFLKQRSVNECTAAQLIVMARSGDWGDVAVMMLLVKRQSESELNCI